jgi:hypothetical protein
MSTRARPKRAARPKPTVRPKRAARPKPAARPKRAAPSKRPAKGGAARLKVVRKPAPRPRKQAASRSFPQREGASAKQLLLFELVRARARVQAALQGLTAGAAETRPAAGEWSIREMVLHLHAWDLEVERALEPALRGVRAAWMDHGATALDRTNEALLAPLRSLPWDEALRRFHMGHDRLLEAIESLSEEPVEPWSRTHPLGGMLAILPEHDHHHAAAIRATREVAAPGAPGEATTPQPRTP